MDVTWQQLLVVGAAMLFIGFLLWKYKPTWPIQRLRREGGGQDGVHDAASLAVAIKAARERARGATSARARAEALTEAAKAAALSADAMTSAMGFYLRAMRADPTFCDPVRGISELLRHERPELLETVLWRRLSHLAWSGETAAAVKCAAEELVSLYKRELRNRDRAKAMQKLVGKI
jgi:uncharacterized membrane protein